jgi:3-oxoacyl-[acyl-carrier-protein] synthase II
MIPICILDASVASAAGRGMAAFAAGMRGAPLPPPAPMPAGLCSFGHVPPRPARWLSGFDAAAQLGHKGVANLDRTTQLSIMLCRDLLGGLPLDMSEGREAVGIVLGTCGGSLKSIADFIRSTYAAPAPHLVSPMQFPNTVMNCAAAQCAIWNGLRGLNSTVCAGDLSGFAALQYAMRMLRLDHARLLFAGAVEEYCEFAAFAHESLTPDQESLQTEGGAMFALSKTPGEAAIGMVLGIRLGLLPAGQDGAGMASAIGRLLRDTGVAPQDIGWWSTASAGDPGATEAAAVERALGEAPQVLPRVADRFGHAGGASVALQLAACLALAPEGIGLVTGADAQGQFGCALLRCGQPIAPQPFKPGRQA